MFDSRTASFVLDEADSQLFEQLTYASATFQVMGPLFHKHQKYRVQESGPKTD